MARGYPDDVRAEVVNAVLEHGMTYAWAARRFGMTDSTVKSWVDAATENPDADLRALDATNRERIAELERRVDALEQDGARVEQEAAHVVRSLVHALEPGIAVLANQDQTEGT